MQYINNLSYLDISTNVQKNIKFKSIEKFEEIKHFSFLCDGLSKEQHLSINQFQELEYLAVYDLNLEFIDDKNSLNELRVHKKIINAMLIKDKFPNLKKLVLEKCIDLNFEDSISIIPTLINLSLRYMKEIYEFPNFVNPKNIKKVSLLGLSNLKSISNIKKFGRIRNY